MTTPTPSAKVRDAYYTIPTVARQCYELLRPFLDPTTSLLEPSAGGGAFIDAAAQHSTVVALDIAPAPGRSDILTADFLSFDLTAISAAWGAWAMGSGTVSAWPSMLTVLGASAEQMAALRSRFEGVILEVA